MIKKLAKPLDSSMNEKVADLVSELLISAAIIHITHLSVKGPGSYASHKALNEFYDDIVDHADDIAEQYQGIIGKVLIYPEKNLKIIRDKQGAISYLTTLYNKITELQRECPYSEICNLLDETKSLINSTKYKLAILE